MSCFPAAWVVRHITGRDYGIDVMVELTKTKAGKTSLAGNLISIQAKGVKKLRWRRDGLARIAGIKKTTVDYWMNLPMPVFLCVHEVNSQNVYFADVKSYVRAHYGRMLLAKTTFSFEVFKELPLNADVGMVWLVRAFLREMEFPQFSSSLKLLITQERSFRFLQQELRACPSDNEIDELSVSTLSAFVWACETVAGYLGIDWEGPSMRTIFMRDRDRLIEAGVSAGALAWGYDALEPHYQKLVRLGRKLVTEVERQFWATRDVWLVKGSYSDEQRARNQAWRKSEEARLLEARLLRKFRRPVS